MGSLEPGTEFLHLQDILGQQLMLRTSTQVSLFFANEDESTISESLSELKKGLTRLAKGFPWLAAQVVVREKSETNAGVSQIIPCEQDIFCIVNDIRDDPEMPSMAALSEAKFPFRLLHREKIAKASGMGEGFENSNGDPARVLSLQISVIKGGLILTFAGIHPTMDMNGLGQIIYLFSKACRQEPFTTKEIEMGNCPRKDLIPLLGDDYTPGPDVDQYILKPKPTTAAIPESLQDPPVVGWSYFIFNAEKLKLLKAKAATQTITNYISTNDALSALFYKHITKVRVARSPELSDGFLFRCIDGRKLFGLDKEYLGHMVGGTYHSGEPIIDTPLDVLTGTLRQSMLDTPQIVHSMRALVTMFDRAQDKATISYCPNLDPRRDIAMSSWAKVSSYDCDFGLLGKPDCVRRARLASFEGLVYFMPKARDGEIAVAVCLREDDIDALRHDEEFITYAEYVG